ncbi:MAG: hypothetical protein IJS19_00365 [Muribaculaceae bacterium]|nr:hypothetical protein [Muribaculaceae bacterium]
MTPKIKRRSAVGCNTNPKKRFSDSIRSIDSIEVLNQAGQAWSALDRFRRQARRCRDYYFGRQWNDIIQNPDHDPRNPFLNEPRFITEEQHIIKQGKTPLKNNMLRQLGKAIIGQFAQNIYEPMAVTADRDDQVLGEMATIAMQYNYVENELRELDKRTLEYLLVAGVCCGKVTNGFNFEKQKTDTWVEMVNHNMLFWDSASTDTRLWDLSLIGEIHDITIDDVVAAFAAGDESTAETIRDIYARPDVYSPYSENLSSDRFDNADFFSPSDPNLCRVIEVWRRETKTRYLCHDWAQGSEYKIEASELDAVKKENNNRKELARLYGLGDDVALIDYEKFIDRYWYVRWLTPWGDVLREMESPYEHKSHPYTLCIYPNYDGECHSFIADIIDQQRYINRLITMYDFIMGASAKGVLMIPEDAIGDKMTANEMIGEWNTYNGVIFYRAKPGYPIPQQITSNATNVGAMEMVQLQLQLMTEISGISGALQGKQAKSGTASSLYAQESQNSANNLVDILTTFNSWRERRDKKMLQVDLQFYDTPRYINIAGKDFSEEAKNYDPQRIKNVAFDLKICEVVDTPAFRQQANDVLFQLFQAGQINIKQLLSVGAFPFADRLLAEIEKAEREQAEQQQMAAQTQAMLQQGQDAMAQYGNPLMAQALQREGNGNPEMVAQPTTPTEGESVQGYIPDEAKAAAQA